MSLSATWHLWCNSSEPVTDARFEVQLATLVSEPPRDAGWLFEIKLDGYRVVAEIAGGRARLFTRSGNDWTAAFAPIAAAVAALPVRDAALDGEAVALLPDGRSSFQALHSAMSGGAGLVYYAFDLLWLDGRDLRDQPLELRKAALADLIARASTGSAVRFSDHVSGSGAAFFAQACQLGMEGIIAKRAGSPYRGGRSGDWLKIKCLQRQELVIGGYSEPAGARTGFGALLLGVHERPGGALHYAGKVGTGFTRKRLDELSARMRQLERPTSPFVDLTRGKGLHWVEPQLVAEISFTEWTSDGKLRHPSFLALREDKAAADVVREQPEKRG